MTLNIFLDKIEQLSIFLRFPSKMTVNKWKSSGLKERTLYCLLLLLYCVFITDFIRLPWFIIAKCSSENTGSLLAKSSLLLVKIVPNMLAINALWNRYCLVQFLQEFRIFIPVNQSEKYFSKYNKMGMFQIKFHTCLGILLCFTIQIMLPVVLKEPEYFLDVLSFPLTRKNELFEFILIINFIIHLLGHILMMLFNILLFTAILIFIDEFKFLSDKLTNISEKMNREYKGIFFTHIHCNKIITQIIDQHGKLCNLLKVLNAVNKVGCGISILSFITICCVILYAIANNLVTRNGYVLQITFGVLTALAFIIYAYKGIQVNFNVSIGIDNALFFSTELNASACST